MTLSSYDQTNLRILDKLRNSIVWKMKPPTLFYYFWFSCSSHGISLASITLPRNVNYLFSFVIICSSHLSFDILRFNLALSITRHEKISCALDPAMKKYKKREYASNNPMVGDLRKKAREVYYFICCICERWTNFHRNDESSMWF